MSLATDILSVLTEAKSEAPEAVVTVAYGGRTTDGLRVEIHGEAELAFAGEDGRDLCGVRCDASKITVERGNVITVGGVRCKAVDVRTDRLGVTTLIAYEEVGT